MTLTLTGQMTSHSGLTSPADYGWTGEYSSHGLAYLRARHYAPGTGRFITRDTWMGDYNRPLSLNQWGYVEGNPVNYTDPTGFIKQKDAQEAYQITRDLLVYNVYVQIDWGGSNWYNTSFDPLIYNSGCSWLEGDWSLEELKELRKGVIDLSNTMGGLNKFVLKLGHVVVYKKIFTGVNANDTALGDAHRLQVNAKFNDKFDRWTAVHELGHVWDGNNGWMLSEQLMAFTGGYVLSPNVVVPAYCSLDVGHEMPGCNKKGYYYGGIPPKTSSDRFTPREDFAESVASYVYPNEAHAVVLDRLNKYSNNPQINDPNSSSDLYSIYYMLLYYDDFRSTDRGLFIANLIKHK